MYLLKNENKWRKRRRRKINLKQHRRKLRKNKNKQTQRNMEDSGFGIFTVVLKIRKNLICAWN
jgi:hypothetical protein